MKRWALPIIAAVVVAIALTGCGSPSATVSKGSSEASKPVDPPSKMVSKDKVYLGPPETFDPAKYPKAAMNGSPSDVPFFAPAKDEGIVNRVYPAYDNKTFKILINMSECLAPQWYYMFKKGGGTVNPAVSKYGFKVADIFDGGHLKTQTNLMVGYYDFAYVTTNIMTEYWSGNETQAQSLWRGGNDYVVVGAAYDGGVDLQGAPGITSLRQLDGKTVGIMNVGYHSEALLNKALATVGLATESAGGTVKIEMGTPGVIMNHMIEKKIAAAFVWGKYIADAQQHSGYKTLLKWQDMGFGTKMANVWLLARRDIAEKYPQVVQALVQANYDASQQAIKVGDYQPTNDTVYTDYRMRNYGQVMKIINPTKDQIDPQANPAFLHEIIDYMNRCKYFKVPYTYDQLVNDSFYNNVKR